MTEASQQTKDKIYSILRDILVEQFEVDPDSISLESRLYEDFDIDSIDAVDMIVQLKPHLGNRNVSPEDFKQVRTVGDVVDAVSNLLSRPE